MPFFAPKFYNNIIVVSSNIGCAVLIGCIKSSKCRFRTTSGPLLHLSLVPGGVPYSAARMGTAKMYTSFKLSTESIRRVTSGTISSAER